ncbi:MAG: hypothetical protein ACJATI_002609 [Halioglobus sp.]|jgi:hypothetical protein
MKNKKRKHLYWIIGIFSFGLIFKYFTQDSISIGNVIGAMIFALLMEFMHYCMDVYRKDNEEITIN